MLDINIIKINIISQLVYLGLNICLAVKKSNKTNIAPNPAKNIKIIELTVPSKSLESGAMRPIVV